MTAPAAHRGRTYLFLLCPAFSGSTMLYRLIASSPHASSLFGHGNWAGEGQFVTAVRAIMRRQSGQDPRVGGWEDPAVEMPWHRIRREWERCWDLSKPVLVEKSPPNLLRAAAIEEHFSRFGEVRFVVMVRSPFHVRQRPELWVADAEHQRRNVERRRHVLWTTYEALCADVPGTARRLCELVPALGELDPDAVARDEVGVPAVGRSGAIANRNGTTRSLAARRSRELAPHEELLRFFGYELLRPGSPAWDREEWLPEIELAPRLAATPEEVYRAWTEPSLLARWWGRPRIDLRPGGELSLAPYPQAGAGVPAVAGRWIEIEPRRRLRFSWTRPGGDDRLDDAEIEVDLTAIAGGGGTALRLRCLAVARSWRIDCERFWSAKLEELGRSLGSTGSVTVG